MKKIAIVTECMMMGGIEKALISMLESMNRDEYEITVYIMSRGGELESDIPTWIKKDGVYGHGDSIKEKIIINIKNIKLINAFKIMIYMPLVILSKSKSRQDYYLSKLWIKPKEYYDIAISYHNLFRNPVIFAADYIKANRKIAWHHSDIEMYSKEIDKHYRYFKKYNDIFLVSNEAKKKFVKIYPEFKNKVNVFYNIISKDRLLLLSKQEKGFLDKFKGIRLLTIGRLSKEKAQHIIPTITKMLKDDGYDIRWYLVGEGEERQNIENEIAINCLKEEIVLLGMKKNPYSYLSQCDIYVQPSEHECYCTTVTEAKCLGKPMVITNVNGSQEQITNGEDGLIVENGVDNIYKGIKKLLNDKKLIENIKKKLNVINVDTVKEIDKLI